MIRQLRVDDAEAYAALRREMLLASPLAFASSPSDDLFSSLEATRDRHAKFSHKVHVWGTEPDALRHGEQTAAEHHMALQLKVDYRQVSTLE